MLRIAAKKSLGIYISLIKKIFTLDLRSLGVFRILVATLILIDLIVRSTDINVFYTDNGVFPRTALFNSFDRWLVSLHALSGSIYFQGILFILACLFAIALFIGYHTRLATIGSWFLLMSLQHRNPLLNQGGDDLLKLLLFWSIFLPLGARFSLDSILTPFSVVKKIPRQITSMATFAYYVQIISLYLVAYATKTGIEWHQQGTAIYYSLSSQERATFFTHLLIPHESILATLTHGTMVVELFGPLLFLIPFFLGPLRTAVVFIFISFHFGMSLFLRLGPFPWVSITAFIPFLPAWFWDRIVRKWHIFDRKKSQITIYYDKDCGFCTNVVLVLKKYFIFLDISITPAQENSITQKEMEQNNSWILVDEKGMRYFKFDAVIILVRAIPFFSVFTYMLHWNFVHKIGDSLYETIARNRHRICVLPSSQSHWRIKGLGYILGEILIALLCMYGLLWNIETATKQNTNTYYWIGELIGLDQNWTMFAPSPPKENDWYVIQGTLMNGTTVDLFRNGRAVSWSKPVSITNDYKNERWLNYMDRLTLAQIYMNYYGQYFCRTWNEKYGGGNQLEKIDINYVKTKILLHGQYDIPEHIFVKQYTCIN